MWCSANQNLSKPSSSACATCSRFSLKSWWTLRSSALVTVEKMPNFITHSPFPASRTPGHERFGQVFLVEKHAPAYLVGGPGDGLVVGVGARPVHEELEAVPRGVKEVHRKAPRDGMAGRTGLD